MQGAVQNKCNRDRQEKGLLSVNACVLKEDRVEFEYLEGITLEEELDGLLEQNHLELAAQKYQTLPVKITDILIQLSQTGQIII